MDGRLNDMSGSQGLTFSQIKYKIQVLMFPSGLSHLGVYFTTHLSESK